MSKAGPRSTTYWRYNGRRGSLTSGALHRCIPAAFLCALTWIAASPFALGAVPDSVQTVLAKHSGLDRQAVSRLEAGQVVVRLLATPRNSEVGSLGAVVIATPSEYFLSQFRDIGRFKKCPQVPQVGTLGGPPSARDLEKLTLSPADVEALQSCRPGDCKMKLSVPMMEQIEKGIRGSSAKGERVDSVFRSALADYVERYLAGGNPALICYADVTPEICMSKELKELLDEFSLLREYAPVLYQYLAGFRRLPPEGSDSFLYWSEEELGPLKPIWSVTQAAIYSTEHEGVRWNFIASKQIYASHYFRASLGLTVLVDLGQGRTLMLYLNRSRVDGLDGWLGRVKRAIVQQKLRSGMRGNLARVRARLESSYRHSAGAR